MRYSEMTPEQRRKLDDPATFPLHVQFLGKIGTLTHGEVRFLLEHGVDVAIDVADRPGRVERLAGRVGRILGWTLVAARALRGHRGRESSVRPP